MSKRPSEDPTLDGSAAKKAKPEIEGDMKCRILIDNSLVGTIIGKGGATVTRIRDETGTIINIIKGNPGAQQRVVQISGTVENIASAIFLITQLIAANTEDKEKPTELALLVHKVQSGAIIGKAGSTIKQIVTETATRLTLSNEPLPGSTERKCSIFGTPEQLLQASLQVVSLLEQNPCKPGSEGIVYVPGTAANPYGASAQAFGAQAANPYAAASPYGGAASPYGAYGGAAAASPYGAYGAAAYGLPAAPGAAAPYAASGGPTKTEKLSIPTANAGSVIGKGGATIRDIKMQSGCTISINDPDTTDPNSRVVTVTGTDQGIQTALYLIRQRVDAEAAMQGGFPGGASGSNVETLTIPASAAGSVIGKGGHVISSVKMQSGCSIAIADPAPESPNERVVTVTGSATGIQTAMYMIRQLVATATPLAGGVAQDSKTQTLTIPTACGGLVIGKGGSSIRDIQAQSGCNVSIADPAETKPTERVVTVTGSSLAVQMAVILIRQKVETYIPPAPK